MYIVFYISSHGFGHMTRCLGIIENILKTSEYNIYIACDKNQNNFAKLYLSEYKDRIIYKDIITDIGLINKKNTLEVDKGKLENRLIEFISEWKDVVNNEYKSIKFLDIKCIVSDISSIGCMVGNKLKLPTILISNFSWVEQYEYLNLNKGIIDKFKTAYSYVDKLVKYDLCISMESIDVKNPYDVGFVCREIDKNKVETIKQQYGNSIFITCGKSATLNAINIKNFKGTIFTTSGIEINCSNDCNVIQLPVKILDTQNYIAASDIVITKAGWGTIGEAVIGNSSLILIERPNVREDSFNISELKKRSLAISITEEELKDIDMNELKSKLDKFIDYKKLSNYKNDSARVSEYILKM